MMKIGRFEASNTLGTMVAENLHLHEEKPYTFLLDNKGLTWGIHYQTTNKIEKIKKWAEKLGAVVTVVGMESSQVLVEITDPVANSLEKFLEEN